MLVVYFTKHLKITSIKYFIKCRFVWKSHIWNQEGPVISLYILEVGAVIISSNKGYVPGCQEETEPVTYVCVNN